MYLGMPKIAKILTSVEVNRIKTPGWHAVGGVAGLLLQIREKTKGSQLSKSWLLRVRVGETRHPVGLGPFPQVSLAEARERAKRLVVEAKSGINLKLKKQTDKSALLSENQKKKTFKQCAIEYMEAHCSDYRSEKHRKQWGSTLETYAFPIIGNLLVNDIRIHHIKKVLEQQSSDRQGNGGSFWETKNETAKRTLDRVKSVIDYAITSEYRNSANPAIWKGHLDRLLPSRKGVKQTIHHPSVNYKEMGIFMTLLRTSESISSKAIEFLVLTAVRSGSVRKAKWSEIDFKQKVWNIPAENTKTYKFHRVPLSDQAIFLLKKLNKVVGIDYIFPSPTGKSLSDMALSQFMRGMYERGEMSSPAVPHGHRSSFRDWAAEQTNFPDELRKIASQHKVGDAVKEAYQRTDLLEKRRNLMQEWADFLDQVNTNKQNAISFLKI